MPPPDIGVRATVENIDGYKRAMGAIEKANDSAADSIKGTSKAFDGFGKAFDSGIAIAVAAGNLISSVVVGAFNAVVNVIGNVINTIGNLAKNIFDSGVTFSQTMANISSVTRITGKELDSIAKRIIDIGADSAVGPQAVADAFYDVASAVSGTEDQFAVLNAAVAAAEANQGNLAATTDTVISMFNAYGPAVSDATDAMGDANYIADILSQTVAAGKGKLDEFSAAMTPIAGLAAKNNIKLAEFGAAIAYMTKQGIPAEQAATALKNAITALSRETPAMTRALRAMGVTSTKAGESLIKSSIATNGFGKTLQLLEQGAKKTGQNLTTMLGSTEALIALGAIGTEEFQKFFDEFVDGADEATQKMRELQRADVSFQLKLIGSRFQAIGLSISQAVLPAFNKFLTFVNNAFKKINWEKLGAGLDKLGEKLGVMADKLITNLAKELENIDWEKVADDVVNALESIGEFLAGINWEAVIEGAKIALQTIGDVIGGIVSFFSEMGTAVQTQVSIWQNGWNTIVGIVEFAVFAAGQILQGAIDTVDGAIRGIVSAAETTWNSLFGPAGSITTAVAQAWPTVEGKIKAAIEIVTTAVQQVVDAVTGVWDSLFGPAGSITTAVDTAWTQVTTSISNALTPITNEISRIVNGALSIWNTLTSVIPAGIREAWAAVVSVVNGVVGAVRAAFEKVAGAVMIALAPAIAAIQSIQSVLGGGGGGGGGGGAQAKGGPLQEGLNVVGEKGAELIVKHGNRAIVVSHEKSGRLLNSIGMSYFSPVPGGGEAAFNTAKAMLRGRNVRPAPMLSANMMRVGRPAAMPVPAGNSNTTNNSSAVYNRNIDTININNVRGGEAAVRRFAKIQAMKHR